MFLGVVTHRCTDRGYVDTLCPLPYRKENNGLLPLGMLMFPSAEHEEEAVSCDTLGLQLLTLSDLDTKSVPYKHACDHTSSKVSAEGDNHSLSSWAEIHIPTCYKSK